MGNCCFICASDTEDAIGVMAQEYPKERLHLSQGSTQIETKNCKLYETEAQYLVSAIDFKGRGATHELKKKFKDLNVSLEEHQNPNELKYGSIFTVPLDRQRQCIFLVLPLWKGGEHQEKQYLDKAIQNLLDYLSNNNVPSVALEEVGVRNQGYPRQLVVQQMIQAFDHYLQTNPTIQNIWFVANEMSSVALFEQSIKTHIKVSKDINIANTVSPQLKKSSFSMERNDKLKEPLLSST